MSKSSRLASLLLCLALSCLGFAAAPRFEKVSEHCHFFQSKADCCNVAAVVTDDGVLVVDPPAEPDTSGAMDALARLTRGVVRWVIDTDYRFARSGGARRFSDQGARVLGSGRLFELALAPAGTDSRPADAAREEKTEAKPEGSRETGLRTYAAFDRQMRLFPGGVEVRLLGVPTRARTRGDVVVLLPTEKVLIVGDLYVAGRFPEIDAEAGEGSAQGWLEGMKQVLEAVPLLKAAIPQKVEVKPGEEKTLEESVTVLSARGPRSNLQEMKDLVEVAQKLRTEVARAARGGRDADAFLASPAAAQFRTYENLESFTRRLFDGLSKS